MKDKVNQLFREKFFLVLLVLGLLTIVAAAGTVTIRKGNKEMEESPYLELKEPDVIAEEDSDLPQAEESDAVKSAEAVVSEEENAAAKSAELPEVQPVSEQTAEEKIDSLNVGAKADMSLVLDYTPSEKLAWPVQGNVILGYSMDTTTYFPTLDQYKCNPANVIQSEISTPAAAPADARVLEIGSNEEIGNYIKLDLGNEYTAICGQLKEIPVAENEYLYKGDTIGYIAEPTKYYSVEGVNLYFELLHGDEPVDALDYLE